MLPPVVIVFIIIGALVALVGGRLRTGAIDRGSSKGPTQIVRVPTKCMTYDQAMDNVPDPAGMPTFDTWVPITSLCTKFVTHFVCATADFEKQMRMVHKVESAVLPVVDAFCKAEKIPREYAHFSYKGGNVMRFIITNMLLDFVRTHEEDPGVSHDSLFHIIQGHYMDSFKPSDLDFGVTWDPRAVDDFGRDVFREKVHALTGKITERLKELREEFIRDPYAYFEYLKRSEAAKEDDVAALLESMQKEVDESNRSAGSGPKLPFVLGLSVLDVHVPSKKDTALYSPAARNDIFIQFKDEAQALIDIKSASPSDVIVCDISTRAHPLYLSRNESLLFANTPDETFHFDLTRMKLTFELTCTYDDPKSADPSVFSKRLGGEVIDVSVQHLDQDNKMAVMPTIVRSAPGVPEETVSIYTRYEAQFKDQRIGVDCMTLPYLLYDLYRILFEIEAAPWKNAKYGKRIKRLFGLLLCEALLLQRKGAASDDVIELMDELRMARAAKADALPEDAPKTIFQMVRLGLKKVIQSPLATMEWTAMSDFSALVDEYVELNVSLLRLAPIKASPYLVAKW